MLIKYFLRLLVKQKLIIVFILQLSLIWMKVPFHLWLMANTLV